MQKVRQGLDTPKGLGITNGVKKQHDSAEAAKSLKKVGDSEKQSKVTSNGAGTPKTIVNGASHKSETGVKRKAEESAMAPAKHRKTDSTDSQSRPASKTKAVNGMAPSPNETLDVGSSSDTADSVLETITYNQGVKLAEKFKAYYAAYDKEYEVQQAAEAKGEKVSVEDRRKLLDMHQRLAQMKKEIRAASEREHAA